MYTILTTTTQQTIQSYVYVTDYYKEILKTRNTRQMTRTEAFYWEAAREKSLLLDW